MGHTYLRLLYHVVFGTKRRAPSITADLESELYPYLEGIVHRRGGWLLALGGMPDHVHLLVRLKADIHVAEMVRLLKSNSSKWIHERPRPVREFAWQTGYAAPSRSANHRKRRSGSTSSSRRSTTGRRASRKS